MENKKYQIFVSSTYEDLKVERNLIIEHILTLGHLPVGMELFCASDDEQFDFIKKIIDNCDYYILILGGRYGSISEKTGLSFTQMEYRYALGKNIPILVFPYEKIETLPNDKKDKDLKNINNFRNEVFKDRVVKFWNTHSDLTAGVFIALNKQFQENPQLGWQRFEDKTKLLEEINTIRKEKDDLIKENKTLLEKINESKPEIQNLAGLDEKYLIKFRTINYNSKVDATWNEIFSYIGPALIEACTFTRFKSKVEDFIKFISGNFCSVLDDDYAQTIKIQFMAHKLIKVYNAQSVKSGILEYIELTNKGLEYLQTIKTIKSSKATV